MSRLLAIPLFALACDTPVKTTEQIDLATRLGPGQVRAGVVTQPSALFGGSSAEGQVGDFKIYNDRVRFIIQGVRSGGYYVEYGGGILDADLVRAWGQPGMDMLDEHAVMAGLGRLMEAVEIEVVNDGQDGKAAILRVHGQASPMQLLSGAVENHGIIPKRDVTITTDYILRPDAWLLELETTLQWNDQSTTISTVDMAFMGFEVAHSYYPGSGLTEGPTQFGWAGGVGAANEMAMAIMQSEGDFVANAMLQSISNLAPLVMGTNAPITLNNGDTHTWSRYIGLAPDLATLTDAWQAARGEAVQTIGGSVTASGALVAGARVHIMDAEGSPITMATTGTDGTWSADVPAGIETLVEATGRGSGVHYDLAPGSGWYGPYAAEHIRAASLQRMRTGARQIPFADGYGVSPRVAGSANTPLTLTPPATLDIQIADGGSAVVRVDFAEGDPEDVSAITVPSRPSGSMAWLYIKDGFGSIPVEPGEYSVLVHRGTRHSYHLQTVSAVSGETTTISATLTAESSRPGIFSGDPHTHAGPSGDGGLPMEARLVSHAAHGIDIHFGTDHDHIADYRPLLAPLSLDSALGSVVSTEVSPVLRGHFNAYPLEEDHSAPNNGGLMWYQTWDSWQTTQGLFDKIRQLSSDGDVIVQANHPVGGGGLFGAAEYNPETGTFSVPDSWSPQFDAVEVANKSPVSDYITHYMDLVCRGLEPAAVGVSDSHSHRGGVGQAMTYVELPIDTISELEPDHIREAWRARGTVPSTGPILEARVDGAWAPGQTYDGPVTVKLKVWAPEWMTIDGVNVYKNMDVVQTISADGDAPLHLSTEVTLEPEADAVYFFEVTSSQDMSPVYPGAMPWALTSGIKINVDGGKWKTPLPRISGG